MLAGQGPDALMFIVAGGAEMPGLHAVGTMPGVVVKLAAGRNGTGIGRLRSEQDGTHLTWRAPGSSTFGLAVPITADGEYLLRDGADPDAYVRVAVSTAYLLPSSQEMPVYLADRYGNLAGGDDITAAQASDGDQAVWYLFIKNVSKSMLYQIKCWLDEAVDDLEISPNGTDWSSPTTEAAAVALPDMFINSTSYVYVRRTIGVGAAAKISVLNHLRFCFAGRP